MSWKYIHSMVNYTDSASSVLDNTPYSWALNFNQTEFVEWQKEQNDAGYILVDMEIYLDPEDPTFLFFAGLTKENPNQYNWAIAINQTLDNFITKNEDFINSGYRIYDYEVISSEGFIRHSGIWVKDGVDNYSWVFNATDQEEFTSLIKSNETKEKYPVLFNFLDLDQLQTPIFDEQLSPKYILAQNEPNPFTGSTNIPFYLPKPAHLQLEVYDHQGEENRSFDQ